MTDEEDRDQARMLTEMHRALMVPAPGQDLPLISRLAKMEKDWQRMGWAARACFALLLGVGSIAAAWDKIKAWITGAAS